MRSYRDDVLERIAPFVAKPSRYIGREWNASYKDPAAAKLKVALAFPDAYEIGMSHLGLKILYQFLNRRPDTAADRAYAPWTDAEALHRRHGIPLCAIESGLPLAAFDIVGFTLQYELCYTTVLNMLALAGIPLRSADRSLGDPLVIAGGPCVHNPEPIADFVDAFLIGDGEEAIHELAEAWLAWKAGGGGRGALLAAVKAIPGWYVPSLHRPGETVGKRFTLKIDDLDYGALPVPFMEIVHDRASIEVMRGCTQGCRFCQAGYIARPLRELSGAQIKARTLRALQGTGYEEVSLASLSIADLTALPDLVPELVDTLIPDKTSISLPSLRVEALNRMPYLAEEIGSVRKTGFTIAPEAGSKRLRKVINKEGFDEEQIFAAVQNAARSGWEAVKFYFMIGLPTETPEDLDELIRVARESARLARKANPRGFDLTVSVSSFVPKPFTPFQWFAQDPMPVLKEKQHYLRGKLREARLTFKWHQVESSFLEAVFSLGGRSLGPALARAHALGCKFDGWTEHLKFDVWLRALAEAGVDPPAIANRARGLDEPLPWDHIDIGITKKFLKREYRKALEVKGTPDCHVDVCSSCGLPCWPSWGKWAEEMGIKVAPPRIDVERREYEIIRLSPPAAAPRRAAGGQGSGAGGSQGALGPQAPEAETRGTASPPAPAGSACSLNRPPAPAPRPLSTYRPDAPAPSAPAVQRIGFEFRKVGELRFLSHLELVRAFTRAMRRAGIPVAHSQGFNPQPRLTFASALPVGVEALHELAEVDLTAALGPAGFLARVNADLPDGLRLARAWEASLRAGALATRVRAARYEVELSLNGCGEHAGVLADPARCAAFLRREAIPVESFKKGETVVVDARPFLIALDPRGMEAGRVRWQLVVKAGLGGSVRPQQVMRRYLEEVLPAEVAGALEVQLRVTRTGLEVEAPA
jgi:radical SAM family uncharacterized protein/radical SAM-linked protein